LVLLHVADTPVSGVYGSETADRHTEADSRYLDDVVSVLREKGYAARSVLLHGPDRAGRLIRQLKNDPVDLLVVGSHGHGLVRDLLFGQTVDKVRHNLQIPMLIARPDRANVADAPDAGSHDTRINAASQRLDSDASNAPMGESREPGQSL
jgi:manganese transport protein